MASTASGQLRLELMANGEKSSTWGTILNTNLTILEGASSGYVTVSMTAVTVTLSVSDYTLGDYHNAVFKLTGSPVSAATLTVPTYEKVYLISNACGQACTVKTSAGTGISVASGATAILFCDGTDIVDLINGAATAASTTTFTNKTIDTAGTNTIKVNGNTLSASAGTATLTFPNSTDTIVGRATTDTLTNKTLTSPVINTPTLVVNDESFSIRDGVDTTKIAQFQLSGLTTATTRTYTLPNATGTLADLDTAQTFTNKTLTAPVLSGSVTGTFTLAATATVSGSSVSGNITGNAANVTGTVAVANGGTGSTTAANARTALGAAASGLMTASGLTMATNKLLGRNTASTGAVEEITLGTNLSMTGTTLNATVGSAGVSSVDVSGGTTGLTYTGGPITGSGTITTAGTLAIANGGTGAITASAARTALGATATGSSLFTAANAAAALSTIAAAPSSTTITGTGLLGGGGDLSTAPPASSDT